MSNEAPQMAQAVSLIDLPQQNAPITEALTETIAEVIASGAYVLGPFVEQFESALADYLGVKHVLGVTSGTDALLLSMMAMGIGPGDEVITTPFTWFSTAGSIARLGAKPVFVDINPRTYCMEPADVEGVITTKTKAILPVHLYGLPASMERINAIAKANNIQVIEDAAHALGASYHGQKVGTLADVACFSFYPTKNLSALGDAGAVATDNDELADKMRLLRNHGLDYAGPTGYHFPMVGGNFRMSAIQGAVLAAKLPYLDGWIKDRRKHAMRYHEALEHTPLTTPFEPSTRGHVFHQYTVRVRSDARDALMHHLTACHVESRVYYPKPLHVQPCFADLGQGEGTLPESERAAQEVLSLPINPEMDAAAQQQVIDAVQEFFRAE